MCSNGNGAECPYVYDVDICDCDPTEFWTGSACASKLTNQDTCTLDCECNQGKYLFKKYF